MPHLRQSVQSAPGHLRHAHGDEHRPLRVARAAGHRAASARSGRPATPSWTAPWRSRFRATGSWPSPEVEQVFFREARAAAQLKHPDIVSVHEVGRDEDTVYIVSDFVEGATLSRMADRPAADRPREAAELCAKIADALHHAHEAGVVHRDLKPSNIMMDMDGEPHIMDFGLAKRDAGEITMTVDGQVLGHAGLHDPRAGPRRSATRPTAAATSTRWA